MSNGNKQGCLMTLLDFILVILTGGLWLIWILIRYLRNNSQDIFMPIFGFKKWAIWSKSGLCGHF